MLWAAANPRIFHHVRCCFHWLCSFQQLCWLPVAVLPCYNLTRAWTLPGSMFVALRSVNKAISCCVVADKRQVVSKADFQFVLGFTFLSGAIPFLPTVKLAE